MAEGGAYAFEHEGGIVRLHDAAEEFGGVGEHDVACLVVDLLDFLFDLSQQTDGACMADGDAGGLDSTGVVGEGFLQSDEVA